MILTEDGTQPAFNKTIEFQSNQETLSPMAVSVDQKSDNSYAFTVALHFDLGETITFYTSWVARGQAPGNYSINASALSRSSEIDPLFSLRQNDCQAQIIEGAPVLNQPVISPTYHPTGLDPQEMYVYPGQDVEVRCNVTCSIGVRNVILFFRLDSQENWSQLKMNRISNGEWSGTVPMRAEGEVAFLYVEAFSSTGKSSKTKEYGFTVADLHTLDLRIGIVITAMAVTSVVGCVGIFALKRRRMKERL